RFLHYHCVALLEQTVSAYDYKPEMDVYTIVVLTSGDKHKTDILINDFRPKRLDNTYVDETQHKIVYLCPKYVTDKTPEPYQEWLKVINDSLNKQIEETDYNHEIIQEICSLIQTKAINPVEAARMKEEYSEEQYLRNEREKGKSEGIEEGIEQNKLKMAKNLLKANITVDFICETTGLNKDIVQQLKE
ncbi:MAG: hypothetical protein KAH08_06805, partial [Methylococcales bacterium]|nr:hypothetical protein [Methylococcales bacterium]